jgi:putative transcriptional regulator
LAENTWLNAPASEKIIFDAPITERWQAAAQQIGVNLSLMSSHAGHA